MVHSKSTKSDIFSYKCTRPTFVLVRRLYQSDVCTSPTFVRPTFVLSDVCASDVCTGTARILAPLAKILCTRLIL